MSVKIRFLYTYTVKDGHVGTDRETTYVKDKVYDMNRTGADHFISRGRAVEVVAKRRAKAPQKAHDDSPSGQDSGTE